MSSIKSICPDSRSLHRRGDAAVGGPSGSSCPTAFWEERGPATGGVAPPAPAVPCVALPGFRLQPGDELCQVLLAGIVFLAMMMSGCAADQSEPASKIVSGGRRASVKDRGVQHVGSASLPRLSV